MSEWWEETINFTLDSGNRAETARQHDLQMKTAETTERGRGMVGRGSCSGEEEVLGRKKVSYRSREQISFAQ